MADVSKIVSFDMLEKLPGGTYKLKYPKTSVSQVVGIDDAIKVKSVNGKTGIVSLTHSDVGAMQNNAPGTGGNSVKIGPSASATGETSVAMGNHAQALDVSTVSIGHVSKSQGYGGVALGAGSKSGEYGTAIGMQSEAIGQTSIALGRSARAHAEGAIAIGNGTMVLNAQEGELGHLVSWEMHSLNVSGTKNFEIPHPNPNKQDTHVLRHGAVETPSAGDNLYRYKIVANQDNDVVVIDLPDYFIHLNKNVQTWITGHLHFGNGYGVLNRETEKLEIHCELAGKYNVLVIGTRNDDNYTVQEWDIFGAEREKGISWRGETYAFEVDEILEVTEIKEVL